MYANIKPNELLRRQAKRLAREEEERELKRARKDPTKESSAQVLHTVTTHNSIKTTTVVLDSAEAPITFSTDSPASTDSAATGEFDGRGAGKSKVRSCHCSI